MAEKVPVDLHNLSTQSVEELYECVVKKTLELQVLITQHKSVFTLVTPRFWTRLYQLRGRLLNLTELDPSALGITTSKYQQIRDWLDSIEINIAKMDVADHPGQEKKEDNDTVGTLVHQIAQGNERMVVAQVTPSGQGIQQVFTPHFYQRLPHPLSHLLKELPVVDGTDVNLLCDFLLKVIKVRQVGQINDSAI